MTIAIASSGYLQTVELDALLALAAEQDLVIELAVKPGDHLVKGFEAATVLGKTNLEANIVKRIRSSFLLGGERTPTEDIRFQFQQLTDVIVRALSPGINDPFTAMNGIDELASGIALLAERARVAEVRKDDKGVVRLIVPTAAVSEVLEETVGHIAIYGAKDRFIMAGLRKVLDVVESRVNDESTLETLARIRTDLDRREQAGSAG